MSAAPVENVWDGIADQHERNERPPPHSVTAEQAVIGAAILAPDHIPTLAATLRDDDFYRPAHQRIWNTIVDLAATGAPIDEITVWQALSHDQALLRAGGALVLHACVENVPTPTTGAYYAQVVADLAQDRRDIATATWLTQAAHNGTDRQTRRERLEKHLADRNPALRRGADIPTLDELLAQDEDDEPAWIIPGLLERQDRLIVTAGEGAGKSTLLRQVAIMCAAGLHPFRGSPMPPVSVLYVDLENSKRQVRRKTRGLRIQAGQRYEDQRLRLEVRMQGLDLTQSADIGWLNDAVDRYKPDLLITGPVYKLANGDPTKEEHSKPVALAIDRIRADHDVAVILEAHSAKAPAGIKHRPKEPYGWSGWLRWPEFGLHLGDDGALTHWRGQRDERDWPELLLRGGHWPWMPANSEADDRWARIHQCLTTAGERLSNREIGRRTGLDDRTVRRLLERNSRRYDALIQRLDKAHHPGPIDPPEQQGFDHV